MTQNACLECGSAMEEGFIPVMMSYGEVRQTAWHAGKPERSWLGGVKAKEDQVTMITAYRCTKCGLLKLYAKPGSE